MAVRIALAQFESADDVATNLERVERKIAEAAEAGAQLVAFHELSTTDYFCFEDRNDARFDLAEPIPGPSTERVSRAADEHGISVLFPLYEAAGDVRYNTACLLEPGRGVVGTYQKSHVPASRARGDERGAEENYYFSPGTTGFRPLESALGLRIGVLICYDRHHPEGARAYGLQDVDIVFAPTASYRTFIIETLWEAELHAMAFQNSYYVAGINKVGPVVGIQQKGRRYPGRSVIMDPEGRMLERAGDQEGLIFADIDPEKPKRSREALRIFEYRRPDLYGILTEPVRS